MRILPSARRLLLTTLLACLLPAASSHAATGIQIATDGNEPGIAVDASGTAHIAFPSQTGSGSPFTHDYSYCRLPRGATACAPRTRLLTGGAPNGTLFTFGKAQVLVDGARVIVVGDTCCGPGEGVKAWVSTNGGTSFAPPVKLFGSIDVREAMLGPGANSVSAIDAVTTGGVRYATGDLGGSTAGLTPFKIGAGIGPDVDGAYQQAGVGLLNGQNPYAVVSDGTRIWLKRFNPTASGFNTPASWLPPQLIDDDNVNEPVTTYGPSGAFVAYSTNTPRANLTYPWIVRRIGDDGTISSPTELGGSGISAIQGDIQQDAGGRVHTAYLDNRADNRLTYQWSKRGVYWSEPVKLTPSDENIRGMQIGVAPDGGGWIVAGAPNAYTPITVYPLEPKGDADPGVPVPTPLPGGATPPPALPCPAQITVAAGIKAQVRTADCFKDVSKTVGGKSTAEGTIFRTSGSVRVNGVDFTAPASGTVTVHTKKHTVDVKGAYKVQVGSVVLATGSRTWNVTQTSTVDGLSAFGVKLFGLAVSGKADVTFDASGAAVTVNVDLPYPLNAVRGSTTLRATMADGLKVDGVRITATTVPIGPVELRNLDLLYTGASDSFEGSTQVFLPPSADAAITASFGLQGGAFKHMELEAGPGVPPLPLPLWTAPPVILSRVGLSAQNDAAGFRVAGGVKIDAGASIGGRAPVAIDALPSSGGGAYLFVPKSGKYAEIGASGKLLLVDIPLASGKFSLRTDGPITFSGSTGIDFEVVTIAIAAEGGINLSNGDFYAGGKGEACVDFIDAAGCAKASAIVSSLGLAACGSLSLTEKLSGITGTIGLGYERPWGGSGSLGSCQYDKYKPASLGGTGARADRLRIGGAQTISLGGGPTRGVIVKGNGGRPGFTFAGPGGRTIMVPAGSARPQLAAGIGAVPIGPDAIELQVRDPKGAWNLTPAADGPAVTDVLTAAERPDPKVRASVRRIGRARELRVVATNLGGQRLVVRERLGGGAAHELGTVRRSGTSRLRFTPADGPAGKRAIEAVVVTSSGRQVDALQIGSYSAPGPAKLAAPRRVTLTRTAKSLGVRWTKVAGADRYRVIVTATDGRKQILTAPGKATKLTIPAVTRDDKVTVKVLAVDRLGRAGTARQAASPRRAS